MRAAWWLGTCLVLLAVYPLETAGQNKSVPKPAADATRPKEKAKDKPPAATPAEALTVMKNFKAELLYSVPKDKRGSWVNMCVDPKGRLIVSDQYGPLYRITPSPIGGSSDQTKVEKLNVTLGGAHGLLWAF